MAGVPDTTEAISKDPELVGSYVPMALIHAVVEADRKALAEVGMAPDQLLGYLIKLYIEDSGSSASWDELPANVLIEIQRGYNDYYAEP